MNRRRFLELSAAAAAAAAWGSLPSGERFARNATAADAAKGVDPRAAFNPYFLPIVEGFLRNARATGDDFVVCDYPDGRKLKSCCTPSGKTYVSVARMLPAMVEWLRGGRQPAAFDAGGGKFIALVDVLLSIFRNAFDPRHPDFWGYAPSNRPTQLSVEAALVASALVRAGNDFVARLTPEQRANVNKWLASCTQVPERKNNHAWFTACNQAARLELSRTFPEFQGDEAWMLEDLKAMEALGATTTAEGWFTDSPDQPIYDVYNFYVFPNFPLMWGQTIGARYPEWNEKFRARIKTFLRTTPYFFAANGSHPLMGRSLCYRWAVLSPLVTGYREGLWPHAPGLLRTIVRKQLEYHWNIGCFDETRGKLRESFSRDETPVTLEPYIDNGHPYWTMLGFAFLGIPESDPFWTAKEEPLPVEQGDFVQRFDGPKFLLSGTQRTGEVRWVMALNSPKREPYRDKYIKFAWSSHFGFNHLNDKVKVPPDQALVFRNIETGACAGRAVAGVTNGKLLEDDAGVETTWFAQLGDWRFDVVSRIRILGEFEERTHRITAPPEAVGKVEVIEGTYALPADRPARHPPPADAKSTTLKTSAGEIGVWNLAGYDKLDLQTLEGANLIHARVWVLTVSGKLSARQTTAASLHFASTVPPPGLEAVQRGDELAAKWKI